MSMPDKALLILAIAPRTSPVSAVNLMSVILFLSSRLIVLDTLSATSLADVETLLLSMFGAIVIALIFSESCFLILLISTSASTRILNSLKLYHHTFLIYVGCILIPCFLYSFNIKSLKYAVIAPDPSLPTFFTVFLKKCTPAYG